MSLKILGGPVLAVSALLVAGGPISAQVVERETKVTGPKGRTIDRQMTVRSGPGFVDRDLKITRPGGATFERNTLTRTGPGPGFGGPGPRFGPAPRFGPPRPFFGREVIVNNNSGPGWLGAAAIGGGLFGLGMLAGNAVANTPPPPAYYVAPPPNVVYAQPVPYGGPPPAAPTVVVDPVAAEIARLASIHSHTRRDACGILGRMRDPRAIMPLVERLKYDNYTEVRHAAAQALGEIGDPQAAVYLERAATYDKKKEVREAAAAAYSRLPRVVQAPASTSVPGNYQPAPSANNPPSNAPDPNVPPPPPTPDPLELPR